MRTILQWLNPQIFKVMVLRKCSSDKVVCVSVFFFVRTEGFLILVVFVFIFLGEIVKGGNEMGGRKFGVETRQTRRALGVISENVVEAQKHPCVANKRGLSE